MNREAAIGLLDRLHEAQNEFYAGGPDAFDRLLAPDITWVVPGDNRIAGTYRGIGAHPGVAWLGRFSMRPVKLGVKERRLPVAYGPATQGIGGRSWTPVDWGDGGDSQAARAL